MNLLWVVTMAWRDGRTSYHKLLLYTGSIVMGVAAIVAVPSFGDNLLQAVDNQAKELLGADLSLSSRSSFPSEVEDLFDSIGGEQSREVSFSSMAYFPKQEATRLVQVRGLSGQFPYYGRLETEPSSAAGAFQQGSYALVDNTLMLQFGIEVGDVIKLGSVAFEILGRLQYISGESPVFSTLAPRVYLPLSSVDETGLIQRGSRVRYTTYFKLDEDQPLQDILERCRPQVDEFRLSLDTVEKRKQNLSREWTNLNRFLTLVGFVALVLGGVGIASSVHLYIRERFLVVAILRCVGASPKQSLAIYLVQVAVMGLLGAMTGGLLGLLAQQLLPLILTGLVPVQVEPSLSWPVLARGVGIGFVVTFLFAVIPLAPVRRISPLLALRSDYENGGMKGDRLVHATYVLLLAGLLLFSLQQTERAAVGLGFFLGLLAVFALLYAFARTIMYLVRRHFPASWSYESRQALANLYRPHNQTAVLMLALGLGTFFLLTLWLTQASLLHELELTRDEKRPNLILFDIQSDQKPQIRQLCEEQQLPVIQDVPVVAMRISSINGRTTQEIRKDSERRSGNWALVREYRCTYRDHLIESELILSGKFQETASVDSVLISIEERVADELHVSLGDQLVFDVQGVPLTAAVGSIRKVNWKNFQPNFFIVFPTGVLEEAPQFHALVTRTNSPQTSASFQRAIVQNFPNVSAIDLSLVIETIDTILDKVMFAIQFMAIFCIATGFVVLSGAVVSGRYQRLKESLLLRTLGASRRQIQRILLVEYVLLGFFATVTGIVLSLIGSWILVTFFFESSFELSLLPIVAVTTGVVFLTVVIGMFNSRGILDHPPLEVLRSEG